MKVENTEAFVVVIGGTLVIPPLGRAEVDGDHPCIAQLIRSGVLAAVEGGEVQEAADQGPQTVAELRQALDELKVEYPDNARKQDLQALYEQARGQ